MSQLLKNTSFLRVFANRILAETEVNRLLRSTRKYSSNTNLALDQSTDKYKEIIREASKKVEKKESLIPSVEQVIATDVALQSPDYFQVHNLFTVRDLFDARVHLGHKIGSLSSDMRPFIYGERFGTLIFDLDITAFHLRQALNFTAHIAYRKGIILFVSRSPQTMYLVEKTAIECGEYAHTREYFTHILTNSEKKFGGVTRLPDLIIVLNTLDTVLSDHEIIKDASKLSIATVGVVDSNCAPNLITYPVPGNDDSYTSIELYCKLFKEAIIRGKSKRRLIENQ